MKVRTLFQALLSVALFVMGAHETLDPDMWWHLRTGERIWNGAFPRVDPFSYTRAGVEWIAHEWLADWAMWGLYQAGGVTALILFFAGLGALAYGIIYWRCEGRPYVAGFVVLLTALASAPFWGVRPQMFNILFMALFIFVVEGVRRRPSSARLLFLLPVAMVAWANFHSGYLLGVVLLGTIWVGETIESRRAQPAEATLPTPARRNLLLAAIGSLLAALINPHGVKLWLYPFLTLSSPTMQRFIAEWRSPDFHLPHFWLFAVLLGLGALLWALGRQRGGAGPTVTELLLFLGTGAAGLVSARHIPLFTLVAAPIIARHAVLASEGTPLYPLVSGTARPPATTSLMSGLNVALLVLALLGAAIWTGQRIDNNDTIVKLLYPVGAVDYLVAEGLTDVPIFNEYAWGGYLIWRGLPVYVDGRADVYGDAFLFTYLQTAGLDADWAVPLERYGVETVLIGREAPLATLLASASGWREVYVDDVARVFVRSDP